MKYLVDGFSAGGFGFASAGGHEESQRTSPAPSFRSRSSSRNAALISLNKRNALRQINLR